MLFFKGLQLAFVKSMFMGSFFVNPVSFPEIEHFYGHVRKVWWEGSQTQAVNSNQKRSVLVLFFVLNDVEYSVKRSFLFYACPETLNNFTIYIVTVYSLPVQYTTPAGMTQLLPKNQGKTFRLSENISSLTSVFYQTLIKTFLFYLPTSSFI